MININWVPTRLFFDTRFSFSLEKRVSKISAYTVLPRFSKYKHTRMFSR